MVERRRQPGEVYSAPAERDEELYQSGFGNHFASEARPGALPVGQNSPQRPPLGLYAEQLSGSAFTAPRHLNRRSWLYRIRPSVLHRGDFEALPHPHLRTGPCRDEAELPLAQHRWAPLEIPAKPTDFVDGLGTVSTCGDARMGAGIGCHIYAANRSMERRYFACGDGELLIVPQLGELLLKTELGPLRVGPGEIALIPRNVCFSVQLLGDAARGYICENYGQDFVLPERGPIGANSLAAERDFLSPVAAFEERVFSEEDPGELVLKARGRLYRCSIRYSPLDVVAWHGNLTPCKYDLRRFNTIGSISFDHPDPSIFTVLTSPSEVPGTANADFVIFPERWLVMEESFRPPWYHRNVMSEFMGLIYGAYDAKPTGFRPGAMSLHNASIPHGPDAKAFERARQKELVPEKLSGTMAFMFETRYLLDPTSLAAEQLQRDGNYPGCWADLPARFPEPWD